MMQLLDGVCETNIGPAHRIEYVLLCRLKDKRGKALETFELAPGGDGLCLGFQGWRRGDFGQKRRARLHEN